MKTWQISTGLLSLLVLLQLSLPSAFGLRMRGEELLPGLGAANKQRSSEPDDFTGSGRVAGGTPAPVGAWPWIATIQNMYSYHMCGGVIIDDNWIFTAASCVSGMRARNIMAVTGTVDWWDQKPPAYFVDQIHVHCNFDKPLYHNDVALLHLTEPIKYDEITEKITLAEVDELQEGEKLTFAGWGSTSSSGTSGRYLNQAEGTYLPVDQCRSELGDTENVDVGHVCVKMAAGQGACHGDAGGPLIDSKSRLVGIGNWGVPCALGRPDVYARAAFYNDWIRNTIKGCGRA